MAITVFIPEIWSRMLNLELRTKLVGLGVVNQDYSGEIQQAGDKVHINRPEAVTVGAYTPNSDLTIQDGGGSQTDLDIDQFDYFAIQVDDVYRIQSNVDLLRAYTQDAAYRLQKAVDSYIFAQYTGAHADNVIAKVAYSKTTIYAALVQAAQNLDEKDVPEQGRYVALSPAEVALFRNSPEFISASDLGDTVKQTGMVGQIAGLNVFMTNQLTTATDASSDSVRHCMYGHSVGLTFAMQNSQVESQRMEKRFSWLIKGLTLYGSAAVKPEALGDLRVTVA